MYFRSHTCITELILITDVCSFGTPLGVTELLVIQDLTSLLSFGTPVGVTELILIQDLIGLLSFGTPVGVTELIIIQDLYLYYGVYTCSEIPVGITEITERILVLQSLFLYGSTCKYYKTYTGTSYLTCTTKYILV